MPRRKIVDPETGLSGRQKSLLFAVVKEYCDYGQSVGSKELKEKYGFRFSSATIRNELVCLRDMGYLFQPFTNSSSKPTERAFKLFISHMMIGLQITREQQEDLRRQIHEMEIKQTSLSKEISRLLALQTGGVAFTVDKKSESVAGMRNLLTAPGEGKVSDILDFLDNLDEYKQFLLEGEVSETVQSLNKLTNSEQQSIKTIIGGEHATLPLGKGYGMVATEVYLEHGEKTVIGVITPIQLLGRKKNLEIVEGIAKVLSKKSKPEN